MSVQVAYLVIEFVPMFVIPLSMQYWVAHLIDDLQLRD